MKILFISLGCDKNLVDSERMLGLLEQEHFTMTDSETEADVIVVNTCCFIGDAKEESIQNILEMAEYRKHGPCKALIVTGCLAQRYRQEVIDEIPEVDAVLGTNSFDKLIPAIRAALEKNEKSLILEPLREGQASSHDRGPLRLLKDRRGLRQALYLLHHPEGPRKLPECSDGEPPSGGGDAGGAGCEGADFGSTGDHSLRKGSLRREEPS